MAEMWGSAMGPVTWRLCHIYGNNSIQAQSGFGYFPEKWVLFCHLPVFLPPSISSFFLLPSILPVSFSLPLSLPPCLPLSLPSSSLGKGDALYIFFLFSLRLSLPPSSSLIFSFPLFFLLLPLLWGGRTGQGDTDTFELLLQTVGHLHRKGQLCL